MEKTKLHTFEGGMDQDTSAFKYPNNKYYKARNMRLTVDENSQQFSFTTIDGSSLNFSITNYIYHGHCFVRDSLVLFLRYTGKSSPEHIILEVDPTSLSTTSGELDLSDSGSNNLVYEGFLGWTEGDLVSAVGVYEASDIRKVYFSDGQHPVSVVNLDKDYTGYDPEDLYIIPISDHDSIVFTEVLEGGQLPAGQVQYTYLLYNEYGPQTYFAPPSPMIPITQGAVKSASAYPNQFSGGVKEDTCNKTFKFEITNDIDTDKFDYIRVIGIYYEDLEVAPTIKILNDFEFNSNTIEFTDSGASYIGIYAVEEFTALLRLFSATSLESKNNHLFAANIEEDSYDVDFDARAYRFPNEGGTYTGVTSGVAKVEEQDGSFYYIYRDSVTRLGAGGSASEGDWEHCSMHTGSDNAAILTDSRMSWTTDEFVGDTLYNITDGSSGTITSNTSNTITTGTFSGGTDNDFDTGDIYFIDNVSQKGTDYSLPETADCINPHNDLTQDFADTSVYDQEEQYAYTADTGITYGYLGGTGPNVEYVISKASMHEERFSLEDFEENYNGGGGSADGRIRMYQRNSNSMSISDDVDMLNTVDNYASPVRCAIDRHFQSDEIYRMGIRFLEDTGRTSYVNWIGDIRFPKLFDVYDNGSGSSVACNLTEEDCISTHTGGTHATIMTDSTASFTVDALIGATIYNITDGSSGVITDNDATTVTVTSLTGGSDNQWENGDEYYISSEAEYLVNRFKIDFTVSIDTAFLIANTSTVGFQIVMVERNSENSTVIDSGWMGSLEEVTDDTDYEMSGLVFPMGLAMGDYATAGHGDTMNDYTSTAPDPDFAFMQSAFTTTVGNLQDNYKEYISPDINFNPTGASTGGSKFYAYAHSAVLASRFEYGVGAVGNYEDYVAYFKQYGVPYTNITTYSSATFGEFDISDFSVFQDLTYNAGNDTAAYSVGLGDKSVWNYCKGGHTPDDNASARGTCGLVYGAVGDDFNSGNSPFEQATNHEAVYVSRRNIIEPYGGITYEDRRNNRYIPASSYVQIVSTGDYSAEGIGDSYVGIFEHLRTMISDNTDINGGDNNIELLYLPVESRYNVVARSGTPFYNQSSTSDPTLVGVKETPGVWAASNTGVSQYDQTYYLYDYNNTYNRVPNVQEFLPAPLGYVVGESYTDDTKIVVSEEKTNRELVDSWTRFLFANEKTLKTEFGAITDLCLLNDNLIAIQPKGIASIAVAEREQITGSTGVALTLGTGSILERYDYISTSVGCSSKLGYVTTPTGIFLYDTYNTGIFMLTQKAEPSLAKVVGMDSYFKGQSGSFDISCTGYDRKHNDILFTFNNDETLAYNEFRGYTTHFLDTDRDYYIYDDRFLWTTEHSNGAGTFAWYTQNVDNSLTLDGAAFDCEIIILSRPDESNPARWDVLEWNSIVKSTATDTEEAYTTFNNVLCENTYQTTNTISSSAFKHKFRRWRVNTLRDNKVVNEVLKPRLRSEWLKSTFTFTPSSNKLWLDSIKVKYTLSEK